MALADDYPDASTLPKKIRKPAYYAEIEPLSPLQQNQTILLKLTIKNTKGEVVKHKDFKVVHGRRIHLMSVNKDLQDYRHLHPRPNNDNEDAIYEVELTPTQGGTYQMYVDAVGQSDGVNYLLPVSIFVPGEQQDPVFTQSKPGTIQAHASAEGLEFDATIDPTPIQAGKNYMLYMTVSQKGEPYRELEPTMQAFAHLIGFNEDLTTLLHAHPMGEKLTSPSQRGGPNLTFHLVFPTAGKYRLFLQIKSDDKDIFVPFDVDVTQ